MLTIEQVRTHSEVSLGHDESKDILEYLRLDRDFTRSIAQLLYIHNDHASKMRIICSLPENIPSSTIPIEVDVKVTIDWRRFTAWINRHDDLTEQNLVPAKIWSFLHWRHCEHGRIGRDALLDTIRNETIDCNKVLVN